MENQHRKITGYRELSNDEIDLMNEGKALAEMVSAYLTKLDAVESTDKRCLNIGRTNLQQGFMWTIRSVAKPESF